MSLLSSEGVVRRNLTIFFIIDVSGSMSGAPIGAVNEAMEKLGPIMQKMDEDNADASVSFAVLTFGSGVRWITPNGPEDVNDFVWKDVSINGLTELGSAARELNSKLSKDGFMASASSSLAPVFILISDGMPTDNYQVELEKLWKNNWFKAGMKIALTYDFDEGQDVLEEFTGSSEAIMNITNPEQLRTIIKYVSVTASQVASKSMISVDQGGQDSSDVTGGGAGVLEELRDDDGNVAVDVDDDWGEW